MTNKDIENLINKLLLLGFKRINHHLFSINHKIELNGYNIVVKIVNVNVPCSMALVHIHSTAVVNMYGGKLSNTYTTEKSSIKRVIELLDIINEL